MTYKKCFKLFKFIFCYLVIFYITEVHTETFGIFDKSNYKHIEVGKKRKKRSSHRKTISTNNQRKNLKIVNIVAKSLPFTTIQEKIINPLKSKQSSAIQVNAYLDPRSALDNQKVQFLTPFGQVQWGDIEKKMYQKDDKMYAFYNGYKLQLSLIPKLQEACTKNLGSSRILDGATVVIEPRTGRVLAMCQSQTSKTNSFPTSARAPAASLIKIITASAAIEKNQLSPFDSIFFRGGCSTLHHENWISDPKLDTQFLTFAQAFGRSCNTVFARLALYDAGLSSLKIYAEKYMFNHPIPSDFRIQTSQFVLPESESATAQEVAEAGAGFGATKLSPIHAALLSATIQNKGLMMAPYIVDIAFNSNGQEIYRAQSVKINQIILPQTADKIQTLMQETISSGTSRRAFHKKGTRYEIDEIGGKTGTLLDPENRDVLYTWFSGIAPINSPSSIAIGTVVASFQNYVVRANNVAQTTLAEYFRIEKNNGVLTGKHND